MNSFGSAYGSASAITPVWATLLVTLVGFLVMNKNAPVSPSTMEGNANDHASSGKYQNP